MINVEFWRHEGKCKCSPMALRCVCVGERESERVCVRARNLKRRGKVCLGSWYRNTAENNSSGWGRSRTRESRWDKPPPPGGD